MRVWLILVVDLAEPKSSKAPGDVIETSGEPVVEKRSSRPPRSERPEEHKAVA
jgi:hypothetical protein